MRKQVRNDNVTLATEAFGDPSDPPLVMIMGATASMHWWPTELCKALADSGRFVIRYDNRDTGASTACPPGEPDYAVEDMADDLIAILDAYGIARADLCGMSLGGLIAQIAALTWPARIGQLILIGSEPLGWEGDPLPSLAPVFLDHLENFATLDWSDRAAVIAFQLEGARLSSGTGAPFDPVLETAKIETELDCSPDPRTAFNHGALTLRDDWTGAVSRIPQPALILHGRDDPILPLPNGEALAATIPDARLTILEGVGHELPPRALPQIVEEITGFLTDAPA
ncbi:alpha/beta fold hydrolase [Pseudoruegeria sp. HB172150]|uniref:alpha/beta fold hydrolase n=1 Tax=Pseudoruegeria sp. HB172150 TaxID=2721164 RepID=UPI001C1304CC|nr:alpha/beta hydrolase [Pseudoruegeria sp. HB172150]